MRLKSLAPKQLLLALLPLLAGFGPVLEVASLAGFNLYAFRLVVILAFVSILLRVWRVTGVDQKAYPFFVLGLVWLIWGNALAISAYDLEAAVRGLILLGFGLLTSSLMLLAVKSTKDVSAVTNGWLVVSVVLCGFGILEYFTDWHLASKWYELQPDYAKPFIVMATFGNPNDFGAFLVLAVALILSRKGQNTGLMWVLFGLFSFLIFLTGNRIGLISIVFMLLFRFSRSPVRTVCYVFGLSALLLNLEGISRYFGYPQLESLLTLLDSTPNECSSVQIRVNMGYVTVQGLIDSVLLGFGPGNFGSIVRSLDFQKLTCGIVDPHNWFLEIAGEYGLLISVGYLTSLIWVFRSASSPTSLARHSGMSPLILMTGFVFAASTSSSFAGLPMNWLYFGILIATSLPQRKIPSFEMTACQRHSFGRTLGKVGSPYD